MKLQTTSLATDQVADGFRSAIDTYSGLHAFDSSGFPATPFERRAADLVHAGMRVLEVGCGPGRFVELALSRGATVTAVDPRLADKSASIWGHILGRHGVASAHASGQLELVAGWCPEALEARGARSYDLLVSQSVVHYLGRSLRGKAWAQFERLLTKSGLLAVAVKSIDNAWMSTGFAMKQVEGSDFRWLCGDGVTRTFFTVQGLRRELRGHFEARGRDFCARALEGYEREGETSVWIECVTRPLVGPGGAVRCRVE